jgi:hypothetical protein
MEILKNIILFILFLISSVFSVLGLVGLGFGGATFDIEMLLIFAVFFVWISLFIYFSKKSTQWTFSLLPSRVQQHSFGFIEFLKGPKVFRVILGTVCFFILLFVVFFVALMLQK